MGLTTDPNDPCIVEVLGNGQQKCYLVLSQDELSKGFERPVRRSYTHVVCGTLTTMHQTIAETYARNHSFYGGTYCAGCKAHFPLFAHGDPQFLWDPDETPVGS